MANENGHEEPQRELTEIEEWELERKMLDLAYKNSYLLLSKQTSFEDLMVDNHRDGKSAVLAHDPHEGASYEEIFNILEFYEKHEEYEKCAVLKEILDQCHSSA